MFKITPGPDGEFIPIEDGDTKSMMAKLSLILLQDQDL